MDRSSMTVSACTPLSSPLLSLTADAWDTICSRLERHHLVRLLLTGDAALLSKVRQLRIRPSLNVKKLSVAAIKTTLLLKPRALSMDMVKNVDVMSELTSAMSCLTTLKLDLGGGQLASYGHFSSLTTLCLTDYRGDALPPLPLTLTDLRLDYVSSGWQKELDLSYLANLIRLETWNRSRMSKAIEANYPPSLLTLKTRDVSHKLERVPRTLTALKTRDVYMLDRKKVLLSDLLKLFPDLVSLDCSSTLVIDVAIPRSMTTLVARFTNDDGRLLHTFSALPLSLRQFRFAHIESTPPLTADEIVSSLAHLLPRFDRKSLFRFMSRLLKKPDARLNCATRKLLATLADQRGFGGYGLIAFLAMNVPLSELSLDMSGQFYRLLPTPHYGRNNVVDRYNCSQSRFFATQAALEGQVGNVLWMPNSEVCNGRWHLIGADDGPLAYADQITELNVPLDVCAGCWKCLMAENSFPSLVDIHCAVQGIDDSIVDVLYKHKSRMPRLERIRLFAFRNDDVHLSDMSISKLRSMRLVEKKAMTMNTIISSRTFVYNISVIPVEVTTEDIEA